MRSICVVLCAVLLNIFSFGGAAHAQDDIVAGPVVGHTTDRSARVWMQLSVAKEVSVDCFDASTDAQACSLSTDAVGPSPFTADIPLSNLEPNKTYRIQIKLDGVPTQVPGPACVIRTNPPEGEEATMTVAFGSCLNTQGTKAAPIFKLIQSVKPRAFLFLGNTVYLPEKIPSFDVGGVKQGRQAYRFIADAYSASLRLPDLQTILRTTPCYAAWNDRDFGPPDADKTWDFAEESWSAFQHFWANPDWGTSTDKGCYFSFTLADAEFFVLDSRMHRDPPAAVGQDRPENAPRSMLGEEQLAWLKQRLQKSTASFKVIACGSQLLTSAQSGAHADTWASFQPEQKDFLEWLGAQHISGVVFITGTNHGYGELNALAPADSPTGYPLLELTSSALAGKITPGEQPTTTPTRASAVITENNFGTLDFGGERDHRFITLRLRDGSGKIRVDQTAFLSQLQKR